MERIIFDNFMSYIKNNDACIIKYPEKQTHPEPLSKNARRSAIKVGSVKTYCHPVCQI